MNKKLLDYFDGDDLAANVWESKYKYKDEKTPFDMHVRMAKEFAKVEKKYIDKEQKRRLRRLKKKLSKYGKKRGDLTFKKILELFDKYKYIVPQGSIMSTLGTDIIASLSNCWVIPSPEDSYGGIHKADGELIYLYKRRGGVGVSIDTLRNEGAETNNVAKTTTGAVSFMDRFSNTTREVAMNGRRGALMLAMFINHPDILKFIDVKRDLTKVTGANISVKIFDDFMKAVKEGTDYQLQFPCQSNEPTTIKHVDAKKIWDSIIDSAWTMAEPGVMFWDNMLDYDPSSVYPAYVPTASNPCGEQFLQPFDSCRLMAINLLSFVKDAFTDNSKLDTELLYEVCYEQMRLGDALVDLEIEYIDRIINKILSDPESLDTKRAELAVWYKAKETVGQGRRVGCGITALGDMIAALGVKYDSPEGLELMEIVMNIKMEAELDCSIDMAVMRGPFEGWDPDLEFKSRVGANKYYQFIMYEYPEQYERMMRWGRRNLSPSTIAPTGSVSTQTQTTSGCEPLFKPYYIRRKKINPGEDGVRIDFTDQNGDCWQEFPVLHIPFGKYISKTHPHWVQGDDIPKDELEDIFEKSPWYGATANDINWESRVEGQGILQKYTSNAISTTINLPESVSKGLISEIYMKSWEVGLKGQTVYRDNCRTGVLISEENAKPKNEFSYADALKRPKVLDCKIHTSTSRGVKWNVLVGLLEGKPYEVFAIPHVTNEDEAQIHRIKRGKYNLVKEDGTIILEDFTSSMSSEEEVITRLTSTSFRHGTDPSFITEQLRKSYGDITSFSQSLARVISKYVPEEETGEACPNCSTKLTMTEGCISCKSCGFSKC